MPILHTHASAVDLTHVVTVSTFAMFFGQTITNLCALRLDRDAGRRARVIPLVGLGTSLGFLVVIVFIAPLAWGIGVATLGDRDATVS